MWLVSKNIPRTVAALLVFFAMLAFIGGIGWLVIPRILEQASTLANDLPVYLEDIKKQIASLLNEYPSLREKLSSGNVLEDSLPSIKNLLTGIGQFSSVLISSAFLIITFLSVVIYMLIDPRPLVGTYLLLFPEANRDKAAQALARASSMMVGWVWSNLLVGVMEAAAVFVFLTLMDVPGVWIWVGLALFAEMVPKLGLYIMAVPPTLIALSIDPATAIWVLVFYVLLTELMSDFVMPHIRASTMKLHPVSTLLVMIVMAAAFGVIGALIATPLTAFIKAYYETFYLSSVSKQSLPEQIDCVLHRKT